MNLFSLTSCIYENVENIKINLIKVDSSQISQLQKKTRNIFLLLDRKDSEQKQIAYLVWLLRATILFTFLDFNHESLRLTNQIKEIKSLAQGFPSLLPEVENLERQINLLVESPKNPKRAWLDQSLSQSQNERTAVFTNLSNGRTPGWGKDPQLCLSNLLLEEISYIRNLSDFRNNTFTRVLLPCSCTNSPYHVLINLIYSGLTPTFEVLLYPEEKFVLPKRLALPIEKGLQSKFRKPIFEYNEINFSTQEDVEEIDAWINDSFWNELHKAQRGYSEQLVPAHYLLFKNGTGTFLPKNGRAQVLLEDFEAEFTHDCIVQKDVEYISSGDLVILRNGESGFLLDNASEDIMNSFGADGLFSKATDWKEALDTLTMTYDWLEISKLLRNENANVSPSTIQRWAGAEGFGPRNESDFRALMLLLIKENKIAIDGDPITYISNKWQMLRELRGIRQKAAHVIRNELFEALSKQINLLKKPLQDETIIQRYVNSSAELIVLRVFSVDQVPSYVHPSQIGRLDDLRNNKWLG